MKNNIDDATLQAAMDAACEETTVPNGYQSLDLRPTYAGWKGETPARLHLLKSALDHLPEPTPPVVDGKTPGEVNHDAVANGDYDTYKKWSELSERGKRDVERGASAVLAAFGKQASLDAERPKFALMGAQQGLEEARRAIRKLERQLEDTQESSLEVAIARMEAVTDGAIQKAYWEPGSWMKNIRELLIEAARGEGESASVPSQPAVEADPYAELKEAYAEGKRIQIRSKDGAEWRDWSFSVEPLWNTPPNRYRIKPEPEPIQPWQPAVGDKVQLKGGSFTMTVEQADSDGIACEWHDSNGVPQGRTYTPETLQPA